VTKTHNCVRCGRHTKKTIELSRKSGSIRTFCTTCAGILLRKAGR
jgi:transcription elongation factor Elf1